jgi:hypothetical protein
MKGSIKKIFGRSKKRSSLDNRSGSCHSNSDPSHSGSQDLSKSSDKETTKKGSCAAPSQTTSSKDFTLPAESSLYTLGDDLESRTFRLSRSAPTSSSSPSSSTVDASQPQRPAGLEPIASESRLQVEDDPDVAEATETASNRAPRRVDSKALPTSAMMENDFHSSGMIDMISDSPEHSKAYELIPDLEQTKLPRGGVSIETKAVGRVQVRLDESLLLLICPSCPCCCCC